MLAWTCTAESDHAAPSSTKKLRPGEGLGAGSEVDTNSW